MKLFLLSILSWKITWLKRLIPRAAKMKNRSTIRVITFEIWGRMLKTVSSTRRMWTEERISLNILMILKLLMTVAVVEKDPPTLKIFRIRPKSVAKTTTISKLFQEL